MSLARGDIALSDCQRLVHAMYDEVWGKQWPRQKNMLLKSELPDSIDWDGDYAYGDADVVENFEYECMGGLAKFTRALRMQPGIGDVLVVRREYELLVELLNKAQSGGKEDSVIVLGHPGIGKTTFLLYLLLYRLERKLPTAVQVGGMYYFIFDEQGAVVLPLDTENGRLGECWALVDSNCKIAEPCEALLFGAARVIQVASPRDDGWKSWKQEQRGSVLVMDVPSVMEIAAVGKELGFDTASVVSCVGKWGPCPRTIMRIMEAIGEENTVPVIEDELGRSAASAAARICEKLPFLTSAPLDPEAGPAATRGVLGTTLLFLIPFREFQLDDLGMKTGSVIVHRRQAMPMVPTEHLCNILAEEGVKMNDPNLPFELSHAFCVGYYITSPPPIAAPARWAHKIMMHSWFCSSGSGPIRIYLDWNWEKEEALWPAKRTLVGPLSCPETVGATDSFYWFPFTNDFLPPGVDGVWGDVGGNIYVVQALIVGDSKREYRSPVDGINRIWGRLRHQRGGGKWHFLFVMNGDTDAQEADSLGNRFKKDLEGLNMQVWGCLYG